MIWRYAIMAGYVAVALVFSFVFGGGLIVLGFFALWALVWLVFSVLWGRAERIRQALLKR
jgi:hypothetical protein